MFKISIIDSNNKSMLCSYVSLINSFIHMYAWSNKIDSIMIAAHIYCFYVEMFVKHNIKHINPGENFKWRMIRHCVCIQCFHVIWMGVLRVPCSVEYIRRIYSSHMFRSWQCHFQFRSLVILSYPTSLYSFRTHQLFTLFHYASFPEHMISTSLLGLCPMLHLWCSLTLPSFVILKYIIHVY